MSLVTKEKKLATGTVPGAARSPASGWRPPSTGLPNHWSNAVPAAPWHKLSLAKLPPWL